jgi:hypothetical protein
MEEINTKTENSRMRVKYTKHSVLSSVICEEQRKDKENRKIWYAAIAIEKRSIEI